MTPPKCSNALSSEETRNKRGKNPHRAASSWSRSRRSPCGGAASVGAGHPLCISSSVKMNWCLQHMEPHACPHIVQRLMAKLLCTVLMCFKRGNKLAECRGGEGAEVCCMGQGKGILVEECCYPVAAGPWGAGACLTLGLADDL